MSDVQLGAWLMATYIGGLNLQVKHYIQVEVDIDVPVLLGDGVPDPGDGGDRSHPGLAGALETSLCGQTQHRGCGGQSRKN